MHKPLAVDRDVDDVHNLMDEVAEQQEIASEISDAISNPVGFGNDVDEVGETREKNASNCVHVCLIDCAA